MLDRVLDAVAGADHIVVVGPSDLDVPAEVGLTEIAGDVPHGPVTSVRSPTTRVQEVPPGGGPVCAIAAGLDQGRELGQGRALDGGRLTRQGA